MDFDDVVRRRRSVRSYRPDAPDTDLLDRLVDVARRAPTAGFSQGIDFVVLDAAVLAQVFDQYDLIVRYLTRLLGLFGDVHAPILRRHICHIANWQENLTNTTVCPQFVQLDPTIRDA